MAVLSVFVGASLAAARGARAEAAQGDVAATLVRAQEALGRGEVREAIEVCEAFADRGAPHPDISYDRGVAYLARVRAGGEKPGDLGRAAAGFEEALLLRPGDEGAARALEAVRAEVARRRARGGEATEVMVSQSAGRTVVSLLPEQIWAIGALAASVILALGLLARGSARAALRLGSGVALGLGLLVGLTFAPLALYARHLRRTAGIGVVVTDEARLSDEGGVPLPRGALPEAARVDVGERRGALVHVRWGEVDGYTQATSIRVLRAPSGG
jgi:hypothetical protein